LWAYPRCGRAGGIVAFITCSVFSLVLIPSHPAPSRPCPSRLARPAPHRTSPTRLVLQHRHIFDVLLERAARRPRQRSGSAASSSRAFPLGQACSSPTGAGSRVCVSGRMRPSTDGASARSNFGLGPRCEGRGWWNVAVPPTLRHTVLSHDMQCGGILPALGNMEVPALPGLNRGPHQAFLGDVLACVHHVLRHLPWPSSAPHCEAWNLRPDFGPTSIQACTSISGKEARGKKSCTPGSGKEA
jgi:hypothetical protein